MAKLSVERTLRKAISHERNGQMDEAAEWKRIVDALPEDWFGDETHGIFVQQGFFTVPN